MPEVFKNATGDIVSPDSIKDNTAVVGSFGDDKAVVTKMNGKIEAMSAVCTHMGCIVGFNGETKALDCPCHGSVFEMDGKVKQGPAVKPLGMFEIEVTDKDIRLKE